MSVVKADRFTFTALKARVKTEMQRRNQSGSVAGYGGSTYDYAVAPAAGGVVRAEHRDKLVTPMRAVNNSKFQTEEQVATAINAKVSSAYKAGGSVAFAALPTPDAAHLGFVYNVTDKFTTTDAFVEGAGSKNAAGTNVAIVAVTDGETTNYKYDVLAGFVDLSGYDTAEQSNTKLAGKVDKEEGKGLSSNDFTDEAKAKLDGITFATDEEVAAALAEIYGPDEA